MATIRERWLADALKRLRENAGLSTKEVADRIGVSESTIQRVDRGANPPKESVLRALLKQYNAEETQTALLLELRRQAKTPSWWGPYGDIDPGSYADIEDTANKIRSWQTAFIPGLLQTEEYSRATLEAIFPGESDNLRRVQLRLLRRTRFNQRAKPPELHVILDEAVVRRQVGGPEVMRDQIGYLKKMASRPNITVQVVPFAAGEHVGMVGPRVLLSFASRDFPDVAYVETPAGDLYPEDEDDLARFSCEWGRILKVALTPDESVAMLASPLEE
jgi:transcriptional regulator with XRE-family HTH domain